MKVLRCPARLHPPPPSRLGAPRGVTVRPEGPHPCSGRPLGTARAQCPRQHIVGLMAITEGCAYKNSLAGAGGPGWGLGSELGGLRGVSSWVGVLLPDVPPSPCRADVDGVGLVGTLFPQLRQHRDACPPTELPERPQAAVCRTPLRGAAVSPLALPRYLPWGQRDADPCPPLGSAELVPVAVSSHGRAIPQPAPSTPCRARSSPLLVQHFPVPGSIWRVARRRCWHAVTPVGRFVCLGCV